MFLYLSEWGKAIGELMHDELNEMIPLYFKYLDEQIEQQLNSTIYLKHLPKELIDYIAVLSQSLS